MQGLLHALREHRHVFIVVSLLTLATTFPTIVYVFNTDVFWHPAGSHRDVYIKLWDVWYGKQFLTGQADRFYTDLIFYPEGISLVFHPFFIPHIIVVNALNILLPFSNAFSLAYLVIIVVCALSAYIYLHWLFTDKWIALFGAVVFGFSPIVVGHANHPDIAFIATIPLAVYCFHRGIKENRRVLIAIAGLLTGLTTVITLYQYICLLITLGFGTLAFARARWRDKRFWLNIGLLILSISAFSIWRIYPLLAHSESFTEVATWYSMGENKTDAISYFVNYKNPVFDRLLQSDLLVVSDRKPSLTSYLGYLPLLLIGFGLFTKVTRRRMAPWLLLCALFLIMRLGPHLHINGVDYPNILLPKYYLNQLLPIVFVSFIEADNFMMGALLPLAILTCYGLVALRKRFAPAAKPAFVLALVLVVALEYHIPVPSDRIFLAGDGTISQARLAFLDWLKQEDGEVRLINLPMGRRQSKVYHLYQALSGYPHAAGAISRTPDSAFNYIRANLLLNAWHQWRPISCELVERDEYLAGLAQLEADGFTHVVFHRDFRDAAEIKDSFREAEPAYENDFVRIFRLNDLRESCTDEWSGSLAFTRAYAQALQQLSITDGRQGIMLVIPPSQRTGDHFTRNLRHFADIYRTIVTISLDDEASLEIRHSEFLEPYSSSQLEQYAALWLLNVPLVSDAERTPAFQDWFVKRFHFCQRVQADELAVVDLYLRADIPCSAMDESSALDIQYESGVRLHNASFSVSGDKLLYHLAWTNTSNDDYGFSLQFLNETGDKALQYDQVIYRELLSTHEIDASSLPTGVYSIQLIVYDFETQVSQGGTVTDSGERFERALEIGRLDW